MKQLVPILCAILVTGCGMFISQNMTDIVAAAGDFTMDRQVSHNSLISTDKLIAGDKAIFIEFGADSGLVTEFSRGSERYTVELLSFSSYKGALGVFAETDLQGSYPVEMADNARRNDKLFQLSKGSMFMTIRPERNASMTGASELAGLLADRIKAPTIKPDIYGALPTTNRVEGTEDFFMGRRVFSKHYTEQLAEDLNVRNIKEGAGARYQTDDGEVTFIKIRYYKPEFAKDAVNSYLKSRSDYPVLLPRESLQFYTVVMPDRTETFIADYAEWVYFMPSSPQGNKAREFFEFILRGGK